MSINYQGLDKAILKSIERASIIAKTSGSIYDRQGANHAIATLEQVNNIALFNKADLTSFIQNKLAELNTLKEQVFHTTTKYVITWSINALKGCQKHL